MLLKGSCHISTENGNQRFKRLLGEFIDGISSWISGHRLIQEFRQPHCLSGDLVLHHLLYMLLYKQLPCGLCIDILVFKQSYQNTFLENHKGIYDRINKKKSFPPAKGAGIEANRLEDNGQEMRNVFFFKQGVVIRDIMPVNSVERDLNRNFRKVCT